MKDAERLKVALAEITAGAEASAARIAELEVERERSGEWVSAWHNLDRVMVEFGMDKKAQPQEAEVWLRGRLLRIAELERELAARPVVESPEARKLWERLQSPYALPFVSPTDWATLDYQRTAEILRAFRDSVPPAPAQDEYTKAAVEYAEARIVLDQNKISFYDATCDKAFQSYRALYAAGKRGEASAFRSRPPPADALAPFPDGPAVPPMAVCGGTNFNPPAPADERVTLYIPEFQRGMSGLVYSSSERSRVVDVKRWLAIDARVVREGGAA